MNKKGDITSEDVSKIQNYIMNEDLQGYLDDENTTIAYARIFYRMVPCVLLDGKDLDNDEDLHEGLAAKDEAYIITNLVNNQESWSNSAADEFETGYKKTKYPTKWTSTPKGRQNARYNRGEKRYISGWDKDGMTFHIKALKFFSGLRENENNVANFNAKVSQIRVFDQGRKMATIAMKGSKPSACPPAALYEAADFSEMMVVGV